MKIAVLVPSAAYAENAGARIRYGRIVQPLSVLGHVLELVVISEFNPESDDYDAIILSKCHDAQALLIAQAFASRGGTVGVDLFDDYFSQYADSRMVRFRRWLNELVPWLDFVLCSTATMAAVAKSYREDVPVIQMNDPAAFEFDPGLEDRLVRKFSEAREGRRVQLCWFGIGDNPHFPVGLSDVAAFSDRLAELSRLLDFTIELQILTNARALDAKRLALVASLPIPTTVSEWSEDAEAQLLEQSFACFLPVNAQPFSIAKSQNRVVTALTAGCQVISEGYPLYAPFGELIYRDIHSFVDDLRDGHMRMSAGRSKPFWGAIRQWASADGEAERFAKKLEALDKRARKSSEPAAVIHGISSSGAAHELAQQLGGLSVASPFSKAKLGYDVIFRIAEGTDLDMFVAPRCVDGLAEAARRRLKPETVIGGKSFAYLPPDGDNGSIAATAQAEISLPSQLARYDGAIEQIRVRLHAAFGTSTVFLSENSPLPFGASLEPFEA